jgi:hypothetical protein
MKETGLEMKAIYFNDSKRMRHHVIAFRTQVVKESPDPVVKLLSNIGYGSDEVWLLRVISPPPSRPDEIRFSERMEYWPLKISKEEYFEGGGTPEGWERYQRLFRYYYPDFHELHWALQTSWERFSSGQIVEITELIAINKGKKSSSIIANRQLPPF